MRQRTTRLAVAVVVATLLLLALGGTTDTPVTPPAVADRPAVVFCVEDITRAPDAVRRAVAELDTLDEVAATYHRGAICPDDGARVLRVRQTDLPADTAGYAKPDGVVLSSGGRFAGYDPRERYLVVLHELMHVVLGAQHGPGWDENGVHVHRCDSILSDRSRCIFALDGLTAFDREQVAAELLSPSEPRRHGRR